MSAGESRRGALEVACFTNGKFLGYKRRERTLDGKGGDVVGMRSWPVYGYMTQAQAARELGVSRPRVAQLLNEGKLSRVFHFNRTYVSVYSLRALIAVREDRKVKKGA